MDYERRDSLDRILVYTHLHIPLITVYKTIHIKVRTRVECTYENIKVELKF